VRSSFACAASVSVKCIEPPVTTPGPKPVTALPGLTPNCPVTIVAPILVTVDPASTPNVDAVPSATDAWFAFAADTLDCEDDVLIEDTFEDDVLEEETVEDDVVEDETVELLTEETREADERSEETRTDALLFLERDAEGIGRSQPI